MEDQYDLASKLQAEKDDFQLLVDSELNVPDAETALEACTDCGLILSRKQWVKREKKSTYGCPNGCDNSCETTNDFTGVISIMVPRTSWVARYTRKIDLVPGLYAMNLGIQTQQLEDEEFEDEGTTRRGRQTEIEDDLYSTANDIYNRGKRSNLKRNRGEIPE